MKLKTKLLLLSSAALTITPLATSIKPVNLTTVQAAAKKKNTITVVASSPVYNNHGQEMPHYKGQDYFTFLKQTTLRYYGQPITIKGQRYYSIGQEAYVAAADLAKVNNKEILSLNHNSYVYTAKGKRTRRLLRKNNNYRFTGKYKQNNNATNYVFYRGGHYYQLTTKRIKGNDYFQIGKNQYIRVNNIQSIAGRLLTVSQTTATVTKETHLITASQSGSAVDTGKVLKKGQKFTVDAEIGLDVGANSIPNGYRIKGTNTYIWTKDARLRQNLTLQATSTTEFRTFTVRPPKDSLQFYNANGEKITPDGYFYPKHQLLGVDGKAYVWLPSQNKAVLCYHVVATNKTFDTEESAGHYQTKDLDLGNAFIPVADVEQYGGLKKLSTFNTAAQAKTDAETPASASELAKLKTEVAQAKTTKNTAKYSLSSGQTKQNYDTTITEVENLLRSKRRLSAAEVKLYTWILATRTQDLYGEKVKVKSLKKLTKSEAELLNDILRDAYQNDPTAQKGTYTRLTYDRKQNKIYLETQDEKTGKIISLKEQPLTDYVTEK